MKKYIVLSPFLVQVSAMPIQEYLLIKDDIVYGEPNEMNSGDVLISLYDEKTRKKIGSYEFKKNTINSFLEQQD